MQEAEMKVAAQEFSLYAMHALLDIASLLQNL
jgi:hypothetical protein